VRVAWSDTRDGQADVRYNGSTDGGVTWLGADLRLDGGAAGAFASTGVAIVNGTDQVFVAWSDTRDGQPDVYLAGSVDGGVTWTKDVRLDVGDVLGLSASGAPALACTARRVYAAWADARAGATDVYLNTSP
jgi:hypothetical protein